MNNTGLTAGDILALTKDGDGMFGGSGVGFIILLFIFIWAVFGGNGFGNNGNALTRAELQAGLYNQTTDRNLSDIRTAQCNTDMLINNTNYNNLLQSKELSNELSSCCCENRLAIANLNNDLTTKMNANTQAILDKMCSQEIQNLRDEIAGYRETLNNSVQTANITGTILNQLGTWRANPPYNSYCGAYPYYGTNII